EQADASRHDWLRRRGREDQPVEDSAGQVRSSQGRRRKKLTEAIDYAYVNNTKMACDDCHLQKRNFEITTGHKFEDGVCFKNRAAGPGGCLYPFPALRPT